MDTPAFMRRLHRHRDAPRGLQRRTALVPARAMTRG